MKKSIVNLGKVLNRKEKKNVFGGNFGFSDGECDQQEQSAIVCDPYGNGSECDLDATCQGTNPIYGGANNQFFLGWGSGSCQCV